MSRSNPVESIPNPCQKWISWGGKNGDLKYYDKEAKINISVPLPFTFILLDVLATVKGWHDATESGIFSNEIRDTRAETMVVKSFGGEEIAEGFYKDIRDKVIAAGGRYTTSLYLAFKDEGKLILGNLQFKGAALSAWMDFSKENQVDLYKKAITIDGSTDGKKGSVVFKTPTFKLIDISDTTNEEATNLDKELQTYLHSYFKRTKSEQIIEVHAEGDAVPLDRREEPASAQDDSDSIPF